jgi:hypothetical protein
MTGRNFVVLIIKSSVLRHVFSVFSCFINQVNINGKNDLHNSTSADRHVWFGVIGNYFETIKLTVEWILSLAFQVKACSKGNDSQF